MDDVVQTALTRLDEAVEQVAALAIDELDDEAVTELLAGLHRHRHRTDGQIARLTGLVARRGAHRRDGAPSTASWLAQHLRVSPREAHRQVKAAENLQALPEVRAALESGVISGEHARTLAAAPESAPPDDHAAVNAEQARRVALARRLDPEALRRQLRRDRHERDAAGMNRDEAAQHSRRRAHLTLLPDGMWRLEALLGTVAGEQLATALDACCTPDAAGTPEQLRRTPAQQRADALAYLAKRALDAGDVGGHRGGHRPHVTVTIAWDTLIREARRAGAPTTDRGAGGDGGAAGDGGGVLGDGGAAGEAEWSGPITGETARRLACDAGITRLITGPGSAPLDVGRERYVVPAPMRRALIARDSGCANCQRPAGWCDAHHIRHWARDHGHTRIDNLVLLCTACHHLVHEGGWRIQLVTDGVVMTSPDGRHHHRPRPCNAPPPGPPPAAATGPPSPRSRLSQAAGGEPSTRPPDRGAPRPRSSRPPDERPPGGARAPTDIRSQTVLPW